MTIGLMGCEFVSANKGCEALTYSILFLLDESINTKLTIINFSDTDLGAVPSFFPNINFINVFPSLKNFKYYSSLLICDYILDVTMGDSFSDIYIKKYYNRLVLHKKIAEFFCKNYVLLPQTYGPFLSKKSEKKAKTVLKNAKSIFCRDKLSKDILEEKFNVKNSILTTDMAFTLPYNVNEYKFNNNGKIKIGINISGLLYNGGFSSLNQFGLKMDYKKYIDSLISYFSNNSKYEVHIIPHVIDLSENSHDDDYKISNIILKEYKNCIIAPIFKDPISAKSYISNMDYFIGSRMHSTIAAFSSNVITIPVSYSRKFEGLYNDIKYKYVIDGKKETADNAFKKTIEYIANSSKLKKAQEESIKLIESKISIFIDSLCILLNEEGEKNEHI